MMSSEVLMLVSQAAKQPRPVCSETITSSIGCRLFPSHTRPYGPPRSAGDVLSAAFDLCWLHHQGVMKNPARRSRRALFCAAVVRANTPRRQVLQTVPQCARNSWGRSSAFTGDDITWQVFIWLISHSLAPSWAPLPSWHALHPDGTQEYRKKENWSGQGLGLYLPALSSVMPKTVRQGRRWGKRAEAGDAVLLIIVRWRAGGLPQCINSSLISPKTPC